MPLTPEQKKRLLCGLALLGDTTAQLVGNEADYTEELGHLQVQIFALVDDVGAGRIVDGDAAKLAEIVTQMAAELQGSDLRAKLLEQQARELKKFHDQNA